MDRGHEGRNESRPLRPGGRPAERKIEPGVGHEQLKAGAAFQPERHREAEDIRRRDIEKDKEAIGEVPCWEKKGKREQRQS